MLSLGENETRFRAENFFFSTDDNSKSTFV